ncbi:MAG: hypothetical protein R3281_18005 [Balneolaceae bacterium]|nr:hypothetical protein [Balneolaceae bacterium]
MKRYAVILYLTSILFAIFALTSCDTSSVSTIEETVEFIESTTPIPGAQGVTMDLQNGSNYGSLHVITLSEITDNPYISNGFKKAWCIEWDVSSIKGVQRDVNLHATKGKVYWDKLNYLINHIDDFSEAFPELSWKEIQIAIWAVVDYKPFYIDDIPDYRSFPSTFYKNGEYLFDVDLARELIRLTRQHAVSGNIGAKFAIVIENEGQIVVTSSE